MKSLSVLLIGLFICTATIGQDNTFFIDGFSTFITDENFDYSRTRIRLEHNQSISDNLSFNTEAIVVDQGFAQVLFGPKYTISPSVKIAGGIGITNNGASPFRFGVSSNLRFGNWDGLIVYQDGPGSGYFYITKLGYIFGKTTVGFRSQRFLHTGVYIEHKVFKEFKVKFHSGYDFEFEQFTSALGASVLLGS